MKKRIISVLLMVSLAVSSLCGCTSNKTTESSKKEETKKEDEGYYPVTVDNYERQITIDERPTAVATLGPNCTELFVALGLGDLVIGRTLVNHSRGPLDEYKDAVEAIPELNHESVTREALLSSGADFVYTIDWEIGDEGCNIEECEEAGMNVYVNQATTFEEMYKEIEDIGTIFNCKDKAEEFIKDQKTRIQDVEDKIKESGSKPVKVLVYDSGNDGVFTCSGTNFESLLVEKAGGKNIFDDIDEKQWVTVSYEEVLDRNPDVILIHDYDSPSVEEKIKEIEENPTLSQLDCVKNKRYAIITLESVLAGDRLAYAVESMAGDFYPDLFGTK
ncbi:iron complex transport system substrate-binding protein [Acetitomaculum ruminis DSM 5522]|uniref:Iron complex transport system substrate-binding protein n=1 Tax=Acetitomaculum ruminis DSM 5522 TaxID=1120918 RepID=A0A1I0WFG9_9FIRM|nr:ABC transporter substrate-binding protein [Acetitomaculum ruminis]SFA86723.1 iron complex transport system substrate-binding protein [Acetitomaculum ruminis DSM 5522]